MLCRNSRNLVNLCASAALSLAVLGCPEDKDPDPPPTPSAPNILAFSASANSVLEGGTVELTYNVENATSVKIDATSGDAPLAPSTTLSGKVTTGPITVQTTFTITASKQGATSATKSIVVSVTGPAAVRIDSFTANPISIDRGDTATLSWRTTNATSVKVDIMNGANVVPAGTMFEGTATVMPDSTTIYVITAEGPSGPATAMATVTVNTPVPVINSFNAMPDTILVGETATLAWMVTGATSVTINDGATDVYSGADATGTVDVMPATTTTYTLTATNQFGMAMDTEMVTVNIPPNAMINSFTATPDTITWGGSAILAWDVTNAPDGIEITSSATTTPMHTSNAATGMLTVTPTRTTDYTLLAKNAGAMNAMAMETITVNPVAPSVDSFIANPNPAGVGAEVVLAWSTTSANRVRVWRVSPNMSELLDTTTRVGTGTLAVTLTSTLTTFNVEATNPFGGVNQELEVVGQFMPAILALDVRPASFVGTTTTATITWTTANAVTVELETGGMAVTGFPGTATGTFSMAVSATTEFTLRATSAGGVATMTAMISQLTGELEPNDTSSTALTLAGDGSGASGTLTAGDEDWYAVDVTAAGGNIWAGTSDGAGGCSTDTFMELYGPDGTTLLQSDDDDGPGTCSEITPADAGARNLAMGIHYIKVRGYSGSTTGPYVLTVSVGEAECGNGYTEGGNGEQCDDGNTMDGDNCDAMCQYPLIDTIIGPSGMTVSYTDGIAPAGDQDVFLIDMQIAGHIFAETFSPARPDCDAGVDTILRLFDSQGNQLGSDDSDGTASCSQIDALRDTWAFVPAGQYFLRVEEDGNNAEIVTYTVEIRTLGQGCGNGILETAPPLSEECDDGNGTDGDGCDSQCLFEGLRDIEPNNDAGNAQALTVTATPALALGSIEITGDEDWYEVTVTATAGAYLEARTYVPTLGQCVSGQGDTVMTLFAADGTTQLGENDDMGGGPLCSQFEPGRHAFTLLAQGTYYIRVKAFGSGTIANYVLQVAFRAVNVCGNSFAEAANNEQCDDGNTTDGDGCSANCVVEVAGAVTGTVTAVNFTSDTGFMVYTLDITTPGQSLTATAADASGMCTLDTDLLAYSGGDFGSATLLGGDASDGPGDCAALLFPADRFVTDLSTGTYSLLVRNQSGMPGMTQLTHTIIDPWCGNRLTEVLAGEACDDGNMISNDGCSATCAWEGMPMEFEPNNVAGQANTLTSTIVTGAVIPMADQDFFALRIPQGWHLEAYQSVGVMGDCPTSDPRARLTFIDRDGVTTRATSAFSGFNGNCGRVAPDNFAATVVTNLPGGVYYLRTNEDGDDAEIGQYWVHVNLIAPGCGNNLVEPNLGEQCDDGGTANNDGCNSTCQAEGVFEIEPNNALGDATDSTLVGTGTVTVAGLIDPAAEDDYWQFEVPAGQTLDLYFRIYGTFGDRDTCNGDTTVNLFDAAGAAVPGGYNDDIIFPANLCSFLDAVTLTEGVYFLDISAYSSAGAFGYYADINLR